MNEVELQMFAADKPRLAELKTQLDQRRDDPEGFLEMLLQAWPEKYLMIGIKDNMVDFHLGVLLPSSGWMSPE
jgi:hypothetical protein